MSLRFNTISFLSDFGLTDEFVGVVHSVIHSISPDARVVDITHGVNPHDVRGGGLALARAANYLNPGVVVAVVDPGVGTTRRPVAVEVGHGASILVGPDNGLLGPAVALVGGATRAFEIRNPDYTLPLNGGATFDGRDVFAPAAAHLCNGVPIEALGPEIDSALLVPGVMPLSHFADGELTCEVFWVDHYGHCQLNVAPSEIDVFGRELEIEVAGEPRLAVRVDAYEQIPVGTAGLIVDSSGLVSVAIARGSAAAELDLGEAIEVKLRALEEADRGGAVTNVRLGRRNGES